MRRLYEQAKSIIIWPYRALRQVGDRISARIWKSRYFFILPLLGAAGFVWAAVLATEKALHPGNEGLTLLWMLAIAKCVLAAVTLLLSVADTLKEAGARRKRKRSVAPKRE